MAKTILRARQNGIVYYLNESSTRARNSGRRLILSRTADHGKTKNGWIKFNVNQHEVILDAGNKVDLFNAYNSKERRPHVDRHHIRGMAGKWEGEAFPMRVTLSSDAKPSKDNEDVSRHEGGQT